MDTTRGAARRNLRQLLRRLTALRSPLTGAKVPGKGMLPVWRRTSTRLMKPRGY
jgi:hypothetical protein